MPVKAKTKKSVRKPTVKQSTPAKKERMVSFGHAVADFFKRLFIFNGVTTRAGYWWLVLFLFIVTFLFTLFLMFLQGHGIVSVYSCKVALSVWYFVVGLFAYPLESRRLHDAGFTAKLLWISFLFTILLNAGLGGVSVLVWISECWTIFMFILFLFPSKKQNNRFRD